MNARKAALADNPELILRVLQLSEPPRESWRLNFLRKR